MIRRSTRPLTAAERAQAERPVVDPYEFHPVVLLVAAGYLLAVLLGAALGAACIAAFFSITYLASAARAVVVVFAVAGLTVSAYAIIAGTRALWDLRPHRPRTRRPARSRANAAALVIEIPVARAWRFDVGDDDSPPPLLVQTPDNRFVLVHTDGLDDLYGALDGDGVPNRPCLGTTLTIERFENMDLRVWTAGGALPITDCDLSADAGSGQVWEALGD